jgi:anti-anti-sigma regulatory factor
MPVQHFLARIARGLPLSQDHSPIPLPAVLDVHAVEAFASSIAVAITDRGALLDGSSVERITTPALQALIVAGAAADAANRPFSIKAPSPAFTAALTTLGLKSYLARWIDA